MAIRLSRSSMIAYSSTIIFILLALYTNAERSGPFHFTKLSFRWSTSYCLCAPLTATAPERTRCAEPFKRDFIVRGYWPMYSDDDDTVEENAESFVPAYNQSGCSEIEPPSKYHITRELFKAPLPLNVMMKQWPNVFNHTVYATIDYWRGVWNRYGKCSMNRDSPFHYFKNPIDYLKTHKFLQILAAEEIFPDDREYDPLAIRDAIWNGVGEKPQIRCITDSRHNTTLLNEIMLCFNRDGQSMPCRYDFFGCPEFDPKNGPNFKIKFPAALRGYPRGY